MMWPGSSGAVAPPVLLVWRIVLRISGQKTAQNQLYCGIAAPTAGDHRPHLIWRFPDETTCAVVVSGGSYLGEQILHEEPTAFPPRAVHADSPLPVILVVAVLGIIASLSDVIM